MFEGSSVRPVFVVGQRWLSEAEPDLGLGRVAAVEGRQVSVDFPAAAARRRYAADTAPLLRMRYAVGDRLEDSEGRGWRVAAVDERAGLLRYRCVADADDGETLLPEQALADRLQLNRPYDRLLARRIDSDLWFDLRRRAWERTATLWDSPVYGFAGPRIEWLSHQLFIAGEVAARPRPRVLLADEVGLGKTIEAGLVLHRLVLTERVRRVLLVVPGPLVHQWLVEMLRRFNLAFAVFDEARFAATDGSLNPFEQNQRVLCSLEFLNGHPDIAEAACAVDWNLLLVDEAHHLHWDLEGADEGYRLVERLAARTPAVLLLTATPEQLGRAGHFGRLRLLDPQRFHDYDVFVAEEADYAEVAGIAAALLDGQPLSPAQQGRLETFLGDEARLPAHDVIERLIDRHGTGRVLYRNTRHAITGFPERRLETEGLTLPEAYLPWGGSTTPETGFGQGWQTIDPRVDWLIALARALAPEKLLVICASASTATGLRDHLLEKAALRTAAFHEDMDIVARDRAAAFFADPEEGAQLLVCSEIGSEGRNFQFAHHLVMFDLPFEPELLEQRIGRLDRIGQREVIHLHVPYMIGSAGEVLMCWYRDGLGSFEAICPAAPAVHERLGGELQAALSEPARLPGLLQRARGLTAELNAALEQGRDRLLELHSHRPAIARGLLEVLAADADEEALRRFMTDYWDAFGVEHEPGPSGSLVLREGAHMLSEHFPGLLSGGMTVTLDRRDALDHEDRQFLTWEHPMVRGCIDMLLSGGLGGAAITVCAHPEFRTGSLLCEALFVVDCLAPAELELRRFLPPTPIRLLLDGHGEDRSDELPAGALQGVCIANNRKLVDTVIRSQKTRVRPLLERAEALAQARAQGLIAAARRRTIEELDAERDRLTALARVSPNVGDRDLAELEARREAIVAHLRETRVRFDALRLIVMR
jgi:ATP-dependent helicase HepA